MRRLNIAYCSLLLTLPNEIIQHIVSCLCLIDIINLHKCCRRLRDNIDIGKYVKLNTKLLKSVNIRYYYIDLGYSKTIFHGEHVSNMGQKEICNYYYGNLHGKRIIQQSKTHKIVYKYNHSVCDGICDKYNGDIHKQYMYVNGDKHGEYKIYRSNILIKSGRYSNGHKHSMVRIYCDNVETIIYSHEFTNKIRYIYFDESHIIHKWITYDSRRKLFTMRKYNMCGELKCKYSYKYDSKHYKIIVGTKYTYFASGNIHTQTNYMNGMMHGKYRVNHNNGNVVMLVNYYRDLFHGNYIIYHNNMQIASIEYYYMGLKHGTHSYYNDDGIKHKEQVYEYNKLIKIVNHKI